MANGKWQMTQPFRCKMAKWPSLPMQHGKCQAFRWKMENGQASRCKWQMTGPFDGKRHDRALGRLVTGDRPRSSSLFHFPFSISSMFTAIYIPDFALQCVLRREPELRDRALAIVDDSLPARVRQMTAAARVRGVTAGMTTTQALGRCPALLFRIPGSLEAESACLLQCAETFSPWLEATGEGVATLEWRGKKMETQRRRDAEEGENLLC